jgi:hypothetical protein
MFISTMSTSRRVRIGSGLVLVASSLSVAACVAAAPAGAVPAATSCSGHYTVAVTANEKNSPSKKWKSTASHLTVQGTSCATGKGVAGAFTRASCGYCKEVHVISGYAIKQKYNGGDGSTSVSATKGSALISFKFESFPKGDVF